MLEYLTKHCLARVVPFVHHSAPQPVQVQATRCVWNMLHKNRTVTEQQIDHLNRDALPSFVRLMSNIDATVRRNHALDLAKAKAKSEGSATPTQKHEFVSDAHLIVVAGCMWSLFESSKSSQNAAAQCQLVLSLSSLIRHALHNRVTEEAKTILVGCISALCHNHAMNTAHFNSCQGSMTLLHIMASQVRSGSLHSHLMLRSCDLLSAMTFSQPQANENFVRIQGLTMLDDILHQTVARALPNELNKAREAASKDGAVNETLLRQGQATVWAHVARLAFAVLSVCFRNRELIPAVVTVKPQPPAAAAAAIDAKPEADVKTDAAPPAAPPAAATPLQTTQMNEAVARHLRSCITSLIALHKQSLSSDSTSLASLPLALATSCCAYKNPIVQKVLVERGGLAPYVTMIKSTVTQPNQLHAMSKEQRPAHSTCDTVSDRSNRGRRGVSQARISIAPRRIVRLVGEMDARSNRRRCASQSERQVPRCMLHELSARHRPSLRRHDEREQQPGQSSLLCLAANVRIHAHRRHAAGMYAAAYIDQ